MHAYKAAAGYEVKYGADVIRFDVHGDYSTDKAEEVAVLDSLVPTWITKVSEPEPKKETKQPEVQSVKPASKPKASAK